MVEVVKVKDGLIRSKITVKCVNCGYHLTAYLNKEGVIVNVNNSTGDYINKKRFGCNTCHAEYEVRK